MLYHSIVVYLLGILIFGEDFYSWDMDVRDWVGAPF